VIETDFSGKFSFGPNWAKSAQNRPQIDLFLSIQSNLELANTLGPAKSVPCVGVRCVEVFLWERVCNPVL
jgi:hypothetical protein